ncbi:MAG: Fur family transcriptional regulator [Selenomonadaceae bacterium]
MAGQITMDVLRQRLAAHQYKLTTQRKTVLQVFIDSPGEHLSAEDVYGILRGKDKDIGLATVYRSMELLAEMGILHKMEFGDGCSRYEIGSMSPDEHQHHHLICVQCGKVLEFPDDMLDELEKDVTEKTGFKVVDHQVKFFGYCKECRAKLG